MDSVKNTRILKTKNACPERKHKNKIELLYQKLIIMYLVKGKTEKKTYDNFATFSPKWA